MLKHSRLGILQRNCNNGAGGAVMSPTAESLQCLCGIERHPGPKTHFRFFGSDFVEQHADFDTLHIANKVDQAIDILRFRVQFREIARSDECVGDTAARIEMHAVQYAA